MGKNIRTRYTMNKSNLLLCTGLFINGCMILMNRFIIEIPEIVFIPLALSSSALIISSLVLSTGQIRKRRKHDGGEK
jgi:hypothetical protein